jgi:uncharacterized protein (DUF2062 family)
MPRRFFRKITLKRERLTQQWYLAPFAHLLHDPRLWGISRRNVLPSVALGLFIAYLPFPGHMLAAALLALALRINIPIAVIATLVNNPLTIGPMFYLAFQLGGWLLGLPPRPFDFELSLSWMTDGFVYVWQPLLLGCVLLAMILSISGYVILDLVWRASISDYLAKKRRKAAIRVSSAD